MEKNSKTPYVGKIVENGNSYHIAVPLSIRKSLNLKKGDILKVEISVISDSEGNPKLNPKNAVLIGLAKLTNDNAYYGMSCDIIIEADKKGIIEALIKEAYDFRGLKK